MFIREVLSEVSLEEVSPKHPEYRFGSFELRSDGILLRKSIIVTLPPKELAVLRRLLADQGRVVTIDELRRAGWGNTHVSPDSLPRCVSSLRARLGSELSIATVYKRGYRFETPVNDDASAEATLAFESRNLQSNEREAGEDWGGPGAVGKSLGLVAERPHGLPKLIIYPFHTGIDVPETLGSEIAEETAFRLSRLRKAVVDLLANNAVFALANRGLTALEAGVSLGADLALAGRITATQSHYRLRAEMFSVDNGVQLWVEDFLIPRALISMADSHMARLITTRIGGTFAKTSVGPRSSSRPSLALHSEIRSANAPKLAGRNGDCLPRLRASAPLIA